MWCKQIFLGYCISWGTTFSNNCNLHIFSFQMPTCEDSFSIVFKLCTVDEIHWETSHIWSTVHLVLISFDILLYNKLNFAINWLVFVCSILWKSEVQIMASKTGYFDLRCSGFSHARHAHFLPRPYILVSIITPVILLFDPMWCSKLMKPRVMEIDK